MKPQTIKIITNIFTIIVSVIIAAGGVAILAGSKGVVRDFTAMGVIKYSLLLGIMHLVFPLLFAFPRTFKLGFILLCCYFGGAIATELSHGFKLEAITPLALVFISAYTRDKSIFFPLLKSKNQQTEATI